MFSFVKWNNTICGVVLKFDKDSLFDQTLVRLLWTLLSYALTLYFCVFLCVGPILTRVLSSHFSWNLSPSIYNHHQYVIKLLICPPISAPHHLSPPSAKIPLGWFSQNPLYPWCFHLVNFYPLNPTSSWTQHSRLLFPVILSPVLYWGLFSCCNSSWVKPVFATLLSSSRFSLTGLIGLIYEKYLE